MFTQLFNVMNSNYAFSVTFDYFKVFVHMPPLNTVSTKCVQRCVSNILIFSLYERVFLHIK